MTARLRVMSGKEVRYMFEQMTIEKYCDILASEAPTPGGGSALAIVGAEACSLIEMAINVTLSKLTVDDDNYAYLQGELSTCKRARKCLYKLSNDDAEVYGKIVEARKLPKNNDEEIKTRTAALQKAFHKATLVPLDVMQLCKDVLHRASSRVLSRLSKWVTSDCEIGISLLRTVVTFSIKNVYANTCFLHDQDLKSRLECQAQQIADEVTKY